MKNRFIEYHIADYLEKIYSEAIIVLDTNSLLNLYRYSEETRNKYFEILMKVESRLYLTDHVCTEFYKNRYTLIANRTLFMEEIKELLDEYHGKLLNIIKNSSGSNKYNAALSILKHEDELRTKIVAEIEQSSTNVKEYLDSFTQEIDFKYIQGDDPILEKVITIIKDKISTEISIEEKEKIYKEGEERYKKQIPPGYKDIEKGFPDKFGDLIIWKELQKLSKELDKDILFVSDDRKEDWVISFKGMNLGPRKELIKEFNKSTARLFYSISTNEFIKLISKSYNVENIETLEKETEIIHEKIKEDNYLTPEEQIEIYKMHQDHLMRMGNPIKNIDTNRELLREVRNPLNDFDKNHNVLRRLSYPLDELENYRNQIRHTGYPLDELRKNQDLLRQMRSPFEEFENQANHLTKMNYTLDELSKYQDFIRQVKSPFENLNNQREELIRQKNALRKTINPSDGNDTKEETLKNYIQAVNLQNQKVPQKKSDKNSDKKK